MLFHLGWLNFSVSILRNKWADCRLKVFLLVTPLVCITRREVKNSQIEWHALSGTSHRRDQHALAQFLHLVTRFGGALKLQILRGLQPLFFHPGDLFGNAA